MSDLKEVAVEMHGVWINSRSDESVVFSLHGDGESDENYLESYYVCNSSQLLPG